MTQPMVARGAPQTDAEMIAALEQHIENYRIACEGFEHGAKVAADRIAALRSALAQTQWAGFDDKKDLPACPVCGYDSFYGHKDDCAVGLALKESA